jgi:hypothetical protein
MLIKLVGMRDPRLVGVLVLFLMVVGCGGDGAEAPDAAVLDAASEADASSPDAAVPDAASPDATTGLVTVRLRDRSALLAGASVVFHAPDGSVVAHVMTDSNGEATHEVTAGSMVTIVYQEVVHTRLGVMPGDLIQQTLPYNNTVTPDTSVGTVHLNAPANPPEGTVTYTFMHPSCGAATASVSSWTFDVKERCTDDTGHSHFLIAANGADGVPLMYALALDTYVNPGTTTEVTPASWSTALFAAELGLNDMLFAGTVALVTRFLRDGFEQVNPATVRTMAEGDDIALTWNIPAGYADTYRLDYSLNDTTRRATVIQKLAELPATFTQEAPALFLHPPTFTSTGTNERPAVTVDIPAEGPQPDQVGVDLVWNNEESYWSFSFAPGTSVTVPQLPDELASYRPATDGSAVWGYASFFEADFLNGYDDARTWLDGDYPDYYVVRRTSVSP